MSFSHERRRENSIQLSVGRNKRMLYTLIQLALVAQLDRASSDRRSGVRLPPSAPSKVGEVAEWLKALPAKGVWVNSSSRVRIPLSANHKIFFLDFCGAFLHYRLRKGRRFVTLGRIKNEQ